MPARSSLAAAAAWVRGHALTAAHVLPAVAAAAAVQTWFTRGRFTAAGDVTPFLRDPGAAEFGWLWTHQSVSAGSASPEIARAAEIGAVWLVTALGGGEPLAQRLFYTVLLAGAAAGIAFFASALTRRPLVIAFCGLLGAFNPLVLISSFNPVLIAPIGLSGVLAGLLLRAGRGRPVRPALLATATVGLSYLALNPPTLAMAGVTLVATAAAASWLVGAGATRRAWALLLRAAPLAVLLNLWWLVPVSYAYLTSSGQALAAETDVAAWAWTHAANRLPDVAALNAHWTWPHSEYLPAARTLDRWWWAWLRYLLPAVAFTAPLMATVPHRRRAAGVAAAAALLVFLSKGLHPPLGGVNAWLYDHVPGLWLLREPLNKVGPLLLLCYVTLAVAWFRGASHRLAAVAGGRRAARVAMVAVAAAALVYPWPLYTGAVAPTERPLLPGTRVAVPHEWRELADLVNTDPVAGKALMLPLLDYYQATTDWGYHGADDLARQLLRRPVIQRTAGAYFAGPAGFDRLIGGVEEALLTGDEQAASRLLGALDASHVIVRRDLHPGQAGRPHPDAAALTAAAHEAGGLQPAGRFGVADVFQVTTPRPAAVRLFGAVVAADRASVSDVLAVLPADVTATVEDDGATAGPTAALVTVARSASAQLAVESAARYVVHHSGRASLWRVDRDDDAVRLREQVTIQVGGAALSGRGDLAVNLGGDGLLAAVADTGITVIGPETDTVRLRAGTRLIPFRAERPSPLAVDPEVRDCHAHSDRDPSETALRAEVDDEGVRLQAVAHAACVTAPVTAYRDGSIYEVTLEARTRVGRPARVCVWQEGRGGCAEPEPEPVTGSSWTPLRALVAPAPGTTGLTVFLYADGPDDGTVTLTEYRHLQVRPFLPDHAAAAAVGDPLDHVVDLDAGHHAVEVRQAVAPDALGPASNLGNCFRADARSDREVGLAAEAIPDGVRLRARDHAACVSARLTAASVADRYILEVDYRTVAGAGARVCLWQAGPNRCADLPRLDRTEDWSTLRTTVTPLPGTYGLEVYVYADGRDGRETVTEYRNLRLAPAVDAQVIAVPATEAAELPTVAWQRHHPGRYTVGVANATGPFVVGVMEAFAPGWTLKGVPAGWTARHVEVEGYANGWLLEPSGDDPTTDFRVVAEHRPSRVARGALWVSAAVAAWMLAARGPGTRRRSIR